MRAGEGRAEGLRWPGGRDTHPNVHWGVQGRGSPAMSVTWYGVVALSSENPCGLEGTGPGGQRAGRRGHATVVQCSGKPRVRTRAAVPGGSRCDPVSRRVPNPQTRCPQWGLQPRQQEHGSPAPPREKAGLGQSAPVQGPHLELAGVTAAGQVLRQEGSEGPHDVVEGRQATVHVHTALHQGQAHSQAGQPARATASFRARGDSPGKDQGPPAGPEKPNEGGRGPADTENSAWPAPGALSWACDAGVETAAPSLASKLSEKSGR